MNAEPTPTSAPDPKSTTGREEPGPLSKNEPIETVLMRILQASWNALKGDALLFVIASCVVCLLTAVTLGILAGPLMVGLIEVVRRRLRGQPATVSDVFSRMSTFGTALLITLAIAVGVALGTALLVLPGLIVGVITTFALHDHAYRKSDVIAALKYSANLVFSHFFVVLLLLVVLIAINTVGGMVLLGVLITVPFTIVTMTVAYEELTGLT